METRLKYYLTLARLKFCFHILSLAVMVTIILANKAKLSGILHISLHFWVIRKQFLSNQLILIRMQTEAKQMAKNDNYGSCEYVDR